jgi:hypothetical protein
MIVNVDQEYYTQRQTQNKPGSVITAVRYWNICLIIVDVEKQRFAHILNVCV